MWKLAMVIIGLVNGQPTAQIVPTPHDFATQAECHEYAETLTLERGQIQGVGFACIHYRTPEQDA